MSEQRDIRQARVAAWCTEAFGVDQTTSVSNRAIKLLEEATEAAQAAGVSKDMAHKLVDYVFGRPVGELWQELGGVGVTLLALAHAAQLSADEEEAREVARVLSKSPEHWRARNAAKVAAGLKPEPRLSSRPVRNSKTGLQSRTDAETGDPVPGRNYPGLSFEEWIAGLKAEGWDEYAADGWGSGPIRWVKIDDMK